jgi:hypothetical protein
MSDSIVFKARKAAFNAFKRDLSELFKKHGIGKFEQDVYADKGDYIGTVHFFTVKGETWYDERILQTVCDVIDTQDNENKEKTDTPC